MKILTKPTVLHSDEPVGGIFECLVLHGFAWDMHGFHVPALFSLCSSVLHGDIIILVAWLH